MHDIYNETEYVPHDVMKDTVHEKLKSLLVQHGLCSCRECCSVVAKPALYDRNESNLCLRIYTYALYYAGAAGPGKHLSCGITCHEANRRFGWNLSQW